MRNHERGFTLIEVMIVVGLIAFLMGIAIPNISMALKVNISNSAQELATTIRATYDESVLKGRPHRLVFDIDKDQYWVEIGEKEFLLLTEEQLKTKERKESRMTEEEKKKLVDPFMLAKNITKNKKKLPKGVHFSEIKTSQSKEGLKNGKGFAHVFPHGFIEKLNIHLKDEFGRESTLLVNSVSGKSRVFQRNVQEE